MLERFLQSNGKSKSLFEIIGISFFLTLVLSYVNFFIGGNSLFLVALVSASFAYPIVAYLKEINNKTISNKIKESNVFLNHKPEMFAFWGLFLGVTIGIYLSSVLGFVNDFQFQKTFAQKISGMIVTDNMFAMIFLNNIEVMLFTFVISFISFAGLIFVISWNASIVAYYLFSLGSFNDALLNGLMLLPHGLIEIGGYILAGIAGSILAYRFDKSNNFSTSESKIFVKNFIILISLSIAFILVGAGVEAF